jgi:hypothetical protein
MRTRSPRTPFASRLLAAMLTPATGLALPLMLPFVALAPHAGAQQIITMSQTAGGPSAGASGMITTRSITKYAETLALSPDQKAAIDALHEGYEAAARDSQKTFNDINAEARRAFEDSQDASVFLEKVPKAQREHTARMKALEKSLFDDMKSLLTAEQAEHWSAVERIRRRETQLRGMMSGESVDLTEIIRGLKPDAALVTALKELLNEYEVELDRALQTKESSAGEDEFKPGEPIDFTAMQARIAKQREHGAKIKDINERHARRIREILPENLRDQFADAVRRESFPRVYRPGRVAKTIDAGLKLDGLSADQRTQIQTLRELYERDVAPVNDRWANAIAESEKSGEDGAMQLAGGGSIRIAGQQNPDSPLAKARTARREIDERFRKQFESILTKEQLEKLPKQDSETETVGGGLIIPQLAEER